MAEDHNFGRHAHLRLRRVDQPSKAGTRDLWKGAGSGSRGLLILRQLSSGATHVDQNVDNKQASDERKKRMGDKVPEGLAGVRRDGPELLFQGGDFKLKEGYRDGV